MSADPVLQTRMQSSSIAELVGPLGPVGTFLLGEDGPGLCPIGLTMGLLPVAAVPDIHSEGVVPLGSIPDVVGLAGCRPEAAEGRILQGRDVRSIQVLVADSRGLDQNFHDVTIVDMGDVPESAESAGTGVVVAPSTGLGGDAGGSQATVPADSTELLRVLRHAD